MGYWGLDNYGENRDTSISALSQQSSSVSEPIFSQPDAEKLTFLNQQNATPESAVSMLYDLAKEDDSYKELLAQLLAERENQERAYQWYEDFNKSYYQRTTKDLQAAGLNPWLALQSLGSGGTGSVSPAGSWSGTSGSTRSAKMAEANKDLTRQGIATTGTILAAIAGAIIMALL